MRQMSEETALSQRTVTRYLMVILLVAALARLLTAVYLGDRADTWPVHDQDSYDALAQRVLAGKGFTFDRPWYPWVPPETPTSYYSSTMVLYLAGIYALFGYHPLAARIITALIGTGSCYLVYRLGRRLFSVQVGLLAAGLTAVYAYLVYFSATLMTETLFIAAILLALDTSLDLVERSTWGRWLRLGLTLAIAVLFRMAVLPFVFLLLIWIAFKSKKRPRLYHVLLPLLIIALAVSPWTVRNYRLYGRFMLSESQFGHVFWNANHPDRGASYDFEESAWVAPLPEDIRDLNEADKTYILLARGIRNVLADPVRFLILSLNRAVVMFMFWPSPHSPLISNVSRVFSFGILFPFMLYGLFLSFRNWRRCTLLYLFMIVHVSVYLTSWVLIRYRLPIDPLLILFAALALLDIWHRLVTRWPQLGRVEEMPG